MFNVGNVVYINNNPHLRWKVIRLVEIKSRSRSETWFKVAPIDPFIDSERNHLVLSQNGIPVDYRPWLETKFGRGASRRNQGLEGSYEQFCQENGGHHSFEWNRTISVPMGSLTICE